MVLLSEILTPNTNWICSGDKRLFHKLAKLAGDTVRVAWLEKDAAREAENAIWQVRSAGINVAMLVYARPCRRRGHNDAFTAYIDPISSTRDITGTIEAAFPDIAIIERNGEMWSLHITDKQIDLKRAR